jgi:hypothetical protein
MDLDRLRRAADEAAWLVARDYPADAVASFVAKHRKLTTQEQALLACATRLRVQYPKHIARELEADDLAKRPLRVDASSVLAAIDAGISGRPLLESPAGVLADPDWTRPGNELGDAAAAIERLDDAIRSLRPSQVRWYVDRDAPWADSLSAHIMQSTKPKSQLEYVTDAGVALAQSANVASSDPNVLDGVSSWFNLVAKAISGLQAQVVRLEV